MKRYGNKRVASAVSTCVQARAKRVGAVRHERRVLGEATAFVKKTCYYLRHVQDIKGKIK